LATGATGQSYDYSVEPSTWLVVAAELVAARVGRGKRLLNDCFSFRFRADNDERDSAQGAVLRSVERHELVIIHRQQLLSPPTHPGDIDSFTRLQQFLGVGEGPEWACGERIRVGELSDARAVVVE